MALDAHLFPFRAGTIVFHETAGFLHHHDDLGVLDVDGVEQKSGREMLRSDVNKRTGLLELRIRLHLPSPFQVFPVVAAYDQGTVVLRINEELKTPAVGRHLRQVDSQHRGFNLQAYALRSRQDDATLGGAEAPETTLFGSLPGLELKVHSGGEGLHLSPLVDDDDEIREGGIAGGRDEGRNVHAARNTGRKEQQRTDHEARDLVQHGSGGHSTMRVVRGRGGLTQDIVCGPWAALKIDVARRVQASVGETGVRPRGRFCYDGRNVTAEEEVLAANWVSESHGRAS